MTVTNTYDTNGAWYIFQNGTNWDNIRTKWRTSEIGYWRFDPRNEMLACLNRQWLLEDFLAIIFEIFLLVHWCERSKQNYRPYTYVIQVLAIHKIGGWNGEERLHSVQRLVSPLTVVISTQWDWMTQLPTTNYIDAPEKIPLEGSDGSRVYYWNG